MRVALFVTCLVDNFYPQVAESMVRILNDCGVEVEFPAAQTCCGQPAFNSGYASEARVVGRTLLEAFADYEYVVTPSGSCAGMVHHHYPQLFDASPVERRIAHELVTKTHEFSQFLVNVLGVEDLGARFSHTVTYHPSCHASRLLGVEEEPLRLLTKVRGLQLVPLPHADDCCGFGGAFAVKMPEISTAMVSEKADWVAATGAQVLVGTDMGCLMNIGGRLRHMGRPVRVMHLAELLHEGMEQGRG